MPLSQAGRTAEEEKKGGATADNGWSQRSLLYRQQRRAERAKGGAKHFAEFPHGKKLNIATT